MSVARAVSPTSPPHEALNDRRASFLRQVERRIGEVVTDEGRLEHASRRLLLANDAKRARALVCLALAEAWLVPVADAAEVAVVIELVHGASLLHDDVVDVSDRRRGSPTVNHLEGNAFAVLCGDLVLARALSLLPKLHNGALMVGDALDVVARMTRAAVIEIDARGCLPDPARGLTLWREMAQGKTGALFGLCATLVGRLGQGRGIIADDVVAAAAARLERFGVAFQIVDDLKDLSGADVGKPRGQDVRERALNHPLLVAVAKDAVFAADVAATWQRAGVIADDVVFGICDRALQLGADVAVDDARAAVSDDDDGLAHGALVVVEGWARGLVDQATAVLVAGGAR